MDAIGAKLAERATYLQNDDGESRTETFREYPSSTGAVE